MKKFCAMGLEFCFREMGFSVERWEKQGKRAVFQPSVVQHGYPYTDIHQLVPLQNQQKAGEWA